MTYTIQQLANLAGVSVRTLHHYDQIGLLRPHRVPTNGYRRYEENDLLRLQQILFFRELDFELSQIRTLMEAPDYDALEILADQKKLIHKKKERLEKLILTLTNTMTSIKKKQKLQPSDLYGSFSKAEYEKYKKEAQQKWGRDKVQRSENIVKGWSREKFAAVQAEGEKVTLELAAMVGRPPEEPEVQAAIDRHFKHIIQFYDPSWPHLTIYRGLASMYVDDARFTAFYNKIHPGLAGFMKAAMTVYCDRQEGEQA